MSTITTTQTFNEGDQVTASTLNDIALNSAFATTVVDNSTTALVSNGDGDINSQIIVRDGGITNSKLGLSATGSSQNILTLTAVQDSGNRYMHIRTPADMSSNNSPFEFFTGNAFTFIVDSTAAATIDSSGNVGIGTSSPSKLLHVKSPNTATAETVAAFGNQNIDRGLEIKTNGGAQSLEWGFNAINSRHMVFDTNQTERMRITSSGNVGIGTTEPSHKLEVNGDILIDSGGADGGQLVLASQGFDSMQIDNERGSFRVVNQAGVGTELFTVASGGNVGIGEFNPSNKLQVAGTLRATGNVDFDSNLNVDGNAQIDGNVNINGTFGFNTGTSVTAIETDGTLGGNSDNVLPTEKAIKTYVNAQILASKKDLYPVGSIFTSTSSNHNTPSNVASALGFGTWQAYGHGRVLVGKANSGTFSTAGSTTGAETITLSDAQVPIRDHSHLVFDNDSTTGNSGDITSSYVSSHYWDAGSESYNIRRTSRGSGASKANAGLTSNPTTSPAASAHSNLQPSVVVYMWKRTN